MAGIAVIDIPSGRIEALAGALSSCTRQEYDGPGRAKTCDKRLPYPIRYRPDALLNPAVYHDAMPASIIKPIMAAAFLSDRDVGARWLAAERAAMQRPGSPSPTVCGASSCASNSALSRRMLCADQSFQRCRRPWDVQATALAFGWNEGCADGRGDCGKRDLLFGRAVDASDESGTVAPLATLVPYGRLFAEPLGSKLGAPFRLRRPMPLDLARVQACAAGADGHPCARTIKQCRAGRGISSLKAGGKARAFERAGRRRDDGGAAAAANGQADPRPHLVEGMRGVCPANASSEARGNAVGSRGAAARQDRARGRGGHPERAFVQPSRGNGKARVRTGVRCAHLPRDGLDRRQDRDADVSQRMPADESPVPVPAAPSTPA
jgi:hypothetical protein